MIEIPVPLEIVNFNFIMGIVGLYLVILIIDFGIRFKQKYNNVTMIYSSDSTSVAPLAIRKALPINITFGVLTLLVVLSMIIFAGLTLYRSPDFEPNQWVFIVSLSFGVLRNIFYLILVFKKREKIIHIHYLNVLMLFFDMSVVFDLSDEETFSVVTFSFILSFILLLILLAVLTKIYIEINDQSATVKSSNAQKNGTKTDTTSQILVSTVLCFSCYIAIALLLTSFKSPEMGGHAGLGYHIEWCKEIKNQTELQDALLSFRPDKSFQEWDLILIVITNFDVILISIGFIYLMMFPRKFPPLTKTRKMIMLIVIYNSYAELRFDAIRQSVFAESDMGFAKIKPEHKMFDDISFASRMVSYGSVLYLVLLNYAEGDTASEEEQETERAEENHGSTEAKGDPAKIIIYLMLLFCFFFIVSSFNRDWIELKSKRFDSVVFNSTMKFNKTDNTEALIGVENLEKAIETFIQDAKAYKKRNEVDLDDIDKIFFDDPYEKFGILLPVFLGIVYLFYAGFVPMPHEDRRAIIMLLLFLNMLNYITFNTLYNVIATYAKSVPGLFMKLKICDGFGDVQMAMIGIIFILLYRAFESFAPIEVPNMNEKELNRDI